MNALIFAALLASGSPGSGPIFSTEGAFFAISVPDAAAAARWYSEKLGMRVVLEPPERDGTRMIALSGGGLLVELIEDDKAVPLRQAAPSVERDYRVHGIFKGGVVVDDWDALLARLKARGVPVAIGPFASTAEQRANLIIRDNNGNFIQFFEKRPAPAESLPPAN